MPENLVTRDGFSRPVPRQPAHLHTQAGSGAYLRDSPRVPRRRPFMKPPYAIGSVSSLSGRALAYPWRSPPRVRRHRASKPQGSFQRVLPWQVTMDQLICASLSHTHYWHEMGMLKVPADVPTETGFRLKVDEEQCKHFTWIYLPPTTTPSLNIICHPYVLGDKVCCVFSSHSLWTSSSLDVCMYVWSSHIAETGSTG